MRRAVMVGVVLMVMIGVGVKGSRADEVTLSSGRVLEGIITKEDDTELTVQILWKGFVTVNRASIASITRSTDQEHEQMREQWRKDFANDQQRQQERDKFEASQRAQGLIQYQGRWVTKEELAAKQEKQAQQEREQQEQAQHEQEARAIEQRVQALEEENQRLRQQLAATQEQVAWWRAPFLVMQRDRAHHDENLFRDGQGNLIRVQEQNGQKFFTATDGQRVDLQAHDNHLTFIDAQGHHQDLTPVHH